MPVRRERIPMKPEMPFDLWSIVKQFASREISGISIPVNYCEPLSMLQRLMEDLEYYSALDHAAELADPGEQHAHVAAFSVSPYAGTSFRMGKPFNPLLNETFELERRSELGWRSISEQVSHHPPRSAMHVEGKRWTIWQDYGVAMQFRGNYFLVKPEGTTHLLFDSGNYYTWKKVTTKINNVIIGSLWVDQGGTSEVISHTGGTKCVLVYDPSSSNNSKKKVSGAVTSVSGDVQWNVKGQWDVGMTVSPILHTVPSTSTLDGELASTALVWQGAPLPEGSEKYYYFGPYASQLNEPDSEVAPTDSRYRPDIRSFENGNWQEANRIKLELEERQRARLRDQPEPNPIWFKKETDRHTGEEAYVYAGGYWECRAIKDWKRCPEIF